MGCTICSTYNCLYQVLGFILGLYVLLYVDLKSDESKTVSVEMDFEEIKRKSVIYSNGSQNYHRKMNKAALELCMEDTTLCHKKQDLVSLSRQKLDKEGYGYSKKRSRSKVFGSESIEETKKGAKKLKLTEESRTKRIEELTADITSLSDRIRLLQKQRARDEHLKQYLRASAVEEEISKIRKEKRQKEEEVSLIQKKQAKANWYKDKKSSSSSLSSSLSSDESPRVKHLSKFWAKSVAVSSPLNKGEAFGREPSEAVIEDKAEQASASKTIPKPCTSTCTSTTGQDGVDISSCATAPENMGLQRDDTYSNHATCAEQEVHQGGIVELKPYFMRSFPHIKYVSTKAVRLLMQLPLIIIEVELQGPGSQRLYATELKPGVDAQKLVSIMRQFLRSIRANSKEKLPSREKIAALCKLASTEADRMLLKMSVYSCLSGKEAHKRYGVPKSEC